MLMSVTQGAGPQSGQDTAVRGQARPGAGPRPLAVLGAMRQEALLLAIVVALIIVFGIIGSGFLTTINFSGTLQSATETAMLAIAETFVITMGGIDLSVGATLGLSGVVGALVMGHTVPALGAGGGFAVGAVVALLVGLAAGLANGLLIVLVRITPFIATLATLGVGTGLTLVITNGIDISGVPGFAATWGNEIFAGVLTIPIVITLVAAIIGGIYLHMSRFGQWTFAIGSNRVAARGAGIPVARHTIYVYVLSGLIAGLAGLLVLMRVGTGSPTEGANDELNAIAAVVIGGASLFGGVGTMLGSMLGALILSILLSGLVISGVQPYWQTVVTGLLIAAAVGFQELTKRQGLSLD
jgi:ribose transport system permease protein